MSYGPCAHCGYPLVWLPFVTGPHSIHWRGRCKKRKVKNERKANTVVVWLWPELAERIEKTKPQIEKEIGFLPRKAADLVTHLITMAINEYERKREESQ